MRRCWRILLIVLSFILLFTAALSAAEPEKKDEFVYGVRVWHGIDYVGSFVPQAVDTIHIIAGKNNILTPLQTKVYFWPIQGEYMADWDTKREEVAGNLEILQGGKVIETISKQDYTFNYPAGFYGASPELLVGQEATDEFAAYQQRVNDFWQEASDYEKARKEYEAKISQMMKEMRETGRKFRPEEIPTPPAQPQPPTMYVEQTRQGLIVNLPVGEYRVRMTTPDGEVVPGSEKRLVSFTDRRSSLGYEVRPEDKWTEPMQSYDPTRYIYLDGNQTAYVRAFDVSEYNAYNYSRMVKPANPTAGLGRQDSFAWLVTGDEQKDISLEVLKGGKVIDRLTRRPYVVRQTPGRALGYNIYEWNPEQPEKQPTFYAFKLEMKPGNYTIRAVTSDGRVIPGSVREIRSVRQSQAMWWLAIFPLLAGIAIKILRWYRVSRSCSQVTESSLA